MSDFLSTWPVSDSYPDFETTRIYQANIEREMIEPRTGKVTPHAKPGERTDLTRTFWAQGLQEHDLAVFGATMDESGVEERDFLVLRYGRFSAQLAPSELVLEHPSHFLTRRLAWHLGAIPMSELMDFSSDTFDVEKLVDLSQQMYP